MKRGVSLRSYMGIEFISMLKQDLDLNRGSIGYTGIEL